MPHVAKTSVPILEGTAPLVRLPKSPTWHVKYKAAGKWLRTSTKKKELDAAKKAAAEIIVEARVKEKNNIPVVKPLLSHRFAPSCKRGEGWRYKRLASRRPEPGRRQLPASCRRSRTAFRSHRRSVRHAGRNTVRHAVGRVSAIISESCPSCAGTRKKFFELTHRCVTKFSGVPLL
jgi:hypothetical protein